ncbi:peptidylprolyl isomerase [Mycolicibacterium komossense]|uniref:peptidylprolyl isomerase n=1 Tax=Mycolicibacterium komossense TaxID=1779 RepID=UPI0021F2F3F4|nr:peptidylprolyl isomerase [Mycolicibacterium komossense]
MPTGDDWAQPYPQTYSYPYPGEPYAGQPYPGQPYPGQSPYPQPPYPPPYAGPRPTNAMAIASIVCAFVLAPLGVIFGHISLSQIKKSGEDGRGLAIAGLIVGYLITFVSIIALVFMLLFVAWVGQNIDRLNGGYPGRPGYTAYPTPDLNIDKLPEFTPPAGLGANCAYPPTTTPASRPVKPPRSGKVPTTPANVLVTMTTDKGAIGLELNNGESPCTVNSFISLAAQKYFDGTSCHRLTANKSLSVLQCGDPTGTGTGGPGYTFADEYPADQYPPDDKALTVPLLYPRGTLAMANAGPNTNGSQFFIVYADSKLPPTYTVFGSVDETGMAPVDQIAAAGVTGGNKDGKPAMPVKITSMELN